MRVCLHLEAREEGTRNSRDPSLGQEMQKSVCRSFQKGEEIPGMLCSALQSWLHHAPTKSQVRSQCAELGLRLGKVLSLLAFQSTGKETSVFPHFNHGWLVTSSKDQRSETSRLRYHRKYTVNLLGWLNRLGLSTS